MVPRKELKMSLGIASLTAVLLATPSPAQAGTNMCGELLKSLVLPVETQKKSCKCGWRAPQCCLPGACIADLSCILWSTVTVMTEFASGTTYCDFSPSEAFKYFLEDKIAFDVNILLAGVPDAFMGALDANIEGLEAYQKTLPAQTSYERSIYEKEAYTQEAKVAQSAGGLFCEAGAPGHIDHIAKKALPVTWAPCRSMREGSLDGNLTADLLFFEPGENSLWAALSDGTSRLANVGRWIEPYTFGGVAWRREWSPGVTYDSHRAEI
jgi:hypothetical protein